VGSVVFNCADFGRMRRFWTDALGYAGRDPLGEDSGRFEVLSDPSGRGPNISLDQGEPEGG
jgi:hypothetical protein